MQEGFRARFKDLLNIEIPEWIIRPFDVEVESTNLDTFLKEDFINTFKGIEYFCMNENW